MKNTTIQWWDGMKSKASESIYKCQKGQCIYADQFCDDTLDCEGGEDEAEKRGCGKYWR